MKIKITALLASLVLAISFSASALAKQELRFPINLPEAKEGQVVHVPPTMADLEDADLHPELKRTIRRGYDLFMNTQQLRGKNVFNDMTCKSCHMGEGRLPFAAPVWRAVIAMPNFRGKNQHVNNLEERIAGCFAFSMNGKPPAYGSDDMIALTAYHQWLAKGLPTFERKNFYGRGYPIEDAPKAPSYKRGEKLYADNCAICHSDDGSGMRVDGKAHFPAVWGDLSYNWGAGISRLHTLAGFVRNNMPLGQPLTMSVQESWDLAEYIDSQERPHDPRFTGDLKETRAKYLDTFHKHTYYGLKKQGRLLGDHDNFGEKDFIKPDNLRPRTYK
ncbi:c-type cytochrome [Marinospirillum insulare]|uniref:Cytochrome c n=1 Tax=Marinospirillum insulare TaxID=217169 RepID=A0ABQ6A228_9GAMM|nr:c-type cytochrome [Marinospirillum insulare]GLR64145.1 cytochrome c [Marinospirillum insulare]